MNLEGGCACKSLRYELTATPIIVHACHCRDCQRLTGSAFVINIWIEEAFVERRTAAPLSYELSGGSTGKPHEVFFCKTCGTYVWSKYHASPQFLFVRAGTLDTPEVIKPDVHIFTRSKVPWLELPGDVPAFEAFYEPRKVWSAESRERFRRSSSQGA
jgi:hypothetical protein